MKYNTPSSQLFLIKKWLAMSFCALVPAMQATGLYKVAVLQATGLYNNRPYYLHFPWENPTFAIVLLQQTTSSSNQNRK